MSLSSYDTPRKYINCQFGVNPVELGCTDGLIFDHVINKCVNPEEGPADWWVHSDTLPNCTALYKALRNILALGPALNVALGLL